MADISPSVSTQELEKELKGTEKPLLSPITQSSSSTSMYPSRVILTSNVSYHFC
jgi:hypothetical protein